MSWYAYHASMQTTEIPTAAINALLPFVSGKCTFSGNDKTFYGHCKDISSVFESGTDSCSCCRYSRCLHSQNRFNGHGLLLMEKISFVIVFGGSAH